VLRPKDLAEIHAALVDIEVQGERYPAQMQAMVNS
jgi:hypothetical protein